MKEYLHSKKEDITLILIQICHYIVITELGNLNGTGLDNIKISPMAYKL